MKILITGGAGTLGSNLIDHFLPKGYEILVIDNLATGNSGNLPDDDKLTFVEGTIADRALVENTFNQFKPDIVIHSAASYKDPDDHLEDVDSNIKGSINIVDCSLKHNVKKFIHFQTALAYGRPNIVPIPISHELNPFTSYGISKAAGEKYIMMSGLPWVSFRLANTTGPRLAIGPIPTFYSRIKEGKSCFCSDSIRDFLDMDDFISLMEVAILPDSPNGAFNVSTGQGHSIKEIYDLVNNYLENKGDTEVPVVPVNSDDVQSVILDPSETIKQFGWKPMNTFEQTINKMLSWYDQNGVTAVFSHLKNNK